VQGDVATRQTLLLRAIVVGQALPAPKLAQIAAARFPAAIAVGEASSAGRGLRIAVLENGVPAIGVFAAPNTLVLLDIANANAIFIVDTADLDTLAISAAHPLV